MIKPTVLLASILALAACSSKKPASDSQPAPAPVTIKVVNARAATIFVASQTRCAQWPVAITGPDGRPLRLDGQDFTCDMVREGGCPDVGGCRGAGVFRLEPGQAVETTWAGTAMTARVLARSEVGAGCPADCVEWLPVAAGDYTVTAAAWSACTGDCACTGVPDAPCDLSSVLTGPPDLTASTNATMPGAGVAVVTFVDP